MITLIFKPLRFHSEFDENIFFGWLKTVECIGSYKEIGRELHVQLFSNKISKNELLELEAICKRYQYDLEQLKIFATYEDVDVIDETANYAIESKIGKLADGKIAIVRSKSKDGRPILETYDPITREKTKIKYGPKIE